MSPRGGAHCLPHLVFKVFDGFIITECIYIHAHIYTYIPTYLSLTIYLGCIFFKTIQLHFRQNCHLFGPLGAIGTGSMQGMVLVGIGKESLLSSSSLLPMLCLCQRLKIQNRLGAQESMHSRQGGSTRPQRKRINRSVMG